MYTLKPGWTKARVMEQIKKYNNGTKCVTEFNAPAWRDASGNCCFLACFDVIEVTDFETRTPFVDCVGTCAFIDVHDNAVIDDVHALAESFLEYQCEESI